MSEVLVEDAYTHTEKLGRALAEGLEAAVGSVGLPWTIHRFWPRSGTTFAPSMPHDAREANESLDVPLRRTMRVYMANRGVWDAIVGAGPTCPVPAELDDVDRYIAAYSEFIAELIS